MARARLSQEERKAQTREAILAAATRLFAQRGLEATSLDEIARAAGFTKGAIYGNFADKRALIDAVVERHVVTLDLAQFLDLPLPLSERLRLLGGAVMGLQQKLPREMVILDLEYSLDTLRNPRTHRREWDRFRAESAKLNRQLAAAYAAEKVRPPFEPGELLVLVGMLARAIIRALAETPNALSPRAVETLFGLLAGEAPRAAKTKQPSRTRAIPRG